MERRNFLGLIGAGMLSACIPGSNNSSEEQTKTKRHFYNPVSGHFFPALPFNYNSLEPFIDALTMKLHYEHHHRVYFKDFTAAINDTILETTSMRDIFGSVSEYDDTIRNNAGGYYNHMLFWDNLSASGGQPSQVA